MIKKKHKKDLFITKNLFLQYIKRIYVFFLKKKLYIHVNKYKKQQI